MRVCVCVCLFVCVCASLSLSHTQIHIDGSILQTLPVMQGVKAA